MSIVYHELTKQIEVCEKCDNHWRCYTYKTPVTYIIENLCPNPEVVKAIKKLQKLHNMKTYIVGI